MVRREIMVEKQHSNVTPPVNRQDLHIRPLTGIRAAAALWVLFFHCFATMPSLTSVDFTRLFAKGYLGVDFFFILSGFILAHVYSASFDGGKPRLARFMIARLARIYPLHLVTFLAAVASAVAFEKIGRFEGELMTLDNSVSTAFTNIFLMNSWGIAPTLSWNIPAWSVSAEWAAYLCFPIFIGASKSLRGRPALAMLGALVALGLLAAAAPYLARNPTQPMDLTVRYGLLRVGAEFAAGICLFRMSSDLPQHVRTFLSRYATGLSMAALLAILHFDWGELIAVQDGLTILMAAIIILSLRFSAGQISKVLSSRPMVFLGEVSYGIYLWHGVVLIAWLEVAGRMPEVPVLGWPYRGPIAYALVVTASIVLISIGLAAASHRWIEEPVRQLVRRKLPAK